MRPAAIEPGRPVADEMRPSGVTVAQRHGQALTATLGRTAWCAQVVAWLSAQVGSELRPGRSHGRGDVAIGRDQGWWDQGWCHRLWPVERHCMLSINGMPCGAVDPSVHCIARLRCGTRHLGLHRHAVCRVFMHPERSEVFAAPASSAVPLQGMVDTVVGYRQGNGGGRLQRSDLRFYRLSRVC
jgi:hypothetical protein